MSLQEVTAQITDEGHARAGQDFTVKVDLPDSINEAIKQYGEEIVYNRFMASVVIDLQSSVRTQIRKEDFAASNLETYFTSWKPKLKARGKSVSEKIGDMLGKLTPEEREAVLSQYV